MYHTVRSCHLNAIVFDKISKLTKGKKSYRHIKQNNGFFSLCIYGVGMKAIEGYHDYELFTVASVSRFSF